MRCIQDVIQTAKIYQMAVVADRRGSKQLAAGQISPLVLHVRLVCARKYAEAERELQAARVWHLRRTDCAETNASHLTIRSSNVHNRLSRMQNRGRPNPIASLKPAHSFPKGIVGIKVPIISPKKHNFAAVTVCVHRCCVRSVGLKG